MILLPSPALAGEGELTDDDDPKQKDSVSGSVEIFGNESKITLSHSTFDISTGTSCCHSTIKLDLSTLSGTAAGTDVLTTFSGQSTTENWPETISSIQCR